MKAVLYFLFVLAISDLTAQHSNKIDSLELILSSSVASNERAYVLDELSFEWFAQNLDSSLYYGRAAYKLFHEVDDPKGLSQSATSTAVAFHYLHQWDSAEYYYKEALAIREANNHTPKVASSLNNLGVMYMDKEDYKKATEYYIKAMEVREISNDSMGVAITKSNLGLIFKKQGIYDKALTYYNEAKKDFERFNQLNYLEIALLNLGSIYNTIEEYEKGLQYNRQLSQLATSRLSQRNLAKSHVNLANSHQGLGHLDSSLFYISKALRFFEANDDSVNIAPALLSMSRYLLQNGKYRQAISTSNRLEQINHRLGNREIAIENQLIQAKAYAALNEYKKAYDRLENSYYQKDSFLTQALNKTISDLTFKYETAQKVREISELKISNQTAVIAEQVSANQRNIFILVASIFIIGAALLYLLLRNKSRSNVIVLKSLSEKETLLKEIHHRVKNNLQVISSLLSLQSRFIDDKDAKALVNEGQNRVKSMALIHQKLYQRDNLTGVEALDYIKNLCGTLQSAYGIDADKVSISYEVDNLNLDVDTMIPIGLILNELISNAFKHAFPNGEGKLDIRFQEKANKLVLVVKDNGAGTSNNIEQTDSFGMRMIHSLSRKLEADVNFNFDLGTEASLTISNYKLV
ncbi:MAG: histidine kinase dimerization/phosphoacceptor domain -containing protein [Cyclobacteriaceae bacterium]